jgi:hypothetical protein
MAVHEQEELPSTLHFHGPFTFVGQGREIARCRYAANEGVYLWILGDGKRRFIHYVGETTVFLKRHKEHLTNILGLNYGIFRADAVAANDPRPIFGGMWRDRSPDPVTTTVAQWQALTANVIAYLQSIEVFFAPTSLPGELRKHVEGRIARQLTEQHPQEARFYPVDNWTKMLPAPLGARIMVTSDLPIEGLDGELEV